MRIVVVGSGAAGAPAALLACRQGHDVTVLDPAAGHPGPVSPHRLHSHVFLALFRSLLETHLPDVLADLHRRGARDIPAQAQLPAVLDDREAVEGDERMTQLAVRRQAYDAALEAALREAGIEVAAERAVALVAGDDGRVTGVSTSTGREHPADLVIDAAGRRSPFIPAVDRDRSTALDLVYVTRFYWGERPLERGMYWGTSDGLSWAVFPADGGHRSVTLSCSSQDHDRRRAARDRHAETIAGIEEAADGVAGCTPSSEILTCAGFHHRWSPRRQEGVVAIGDAAATTNPFWGRGCSLALAGAVIVATALESGTDPTNVGRLATDRLRRDHRRFVVEAALADHAVRQGQVPGEAVAAAARHDRLAARAQMAAVNMVSLGDDLSRPRPPAARSGRR